MEALAQPAAQAAQVMQEVQELRPTRVARLVQARLEVQAELQVLPVQAAVAADRVPVTLKSLSRNPSVTSMARSAASVRRWRRPAPVPVVQPKVASRVIPLP
jgi:hypothetical protein